jgi:hypothetical protein
MAFFFSLLLILAWAIICGLIAILYRIARFYQISSGRRSYYQVFNVPLLMFAAGAVAAALAPAEPFWRDLFMLGGGVSLIGLGFYLLRLMMGNRP